MVARATALEIAKRAKDEYEKTGISQDALIGSSAVQHYTINGYSFGIEHEMGESDGLRDAKIKGIKEAVRAVTALGIALPPISFGTSANPQCKNIALHYNAHGNNNYRIRLGPNCGAHAPRINRHGPIVGGTADPANTNPASQGRAVGLADQMYDGTHRFFGNPKRLAFITCTVVHEIGHVLHNHTAPDIFFAHMANEETNIWLAAACQVSQYATNSGNEFVAEYFAGRVCGKTYGGSVTTAYQTMGGPHF